MAIKNIVFPKNTMFDIEQSITDETPVTVTNGKDKKFFVIPKNPKMYLKPFNSSEFIGQELCTIRNIRCTYYFIAAIGLFDIKGSCWYQDVEKQRPRLVIGSYDFKHTGYQYKNVEDYGFSRFDEDLFSKMLTVAPDEENRRQLMNDMMQMLALDIYMGQTDRGYFNFLFEEDENHRVRLAPIFDFECSLNTQFFGQHEDKITLGDLYHFNTIEDCKEFIRRYPMFGSLLNSYLYEDLESVVKTAYGKRRMIVPDDCLKKYQEFDEDRKELIKRIVH